MIAVALLAALNAADVGRVVDRVAPRVMAERHIPGAAIVVVQGDRIVFAKGYGAGIDPATTRFRIGSVTKLFTATAILQLVESGRLRLDDDVRQLLTHTAGFDERLANTAVRRREDVLPLREYLARDLPPRVHPPGTLIQYSNHGYVVLGSKVEEASGLPLERYFRERIFAPLGMSYTTYNDIDGVHGFEYRRGRLREIPQAYLQIGPAAGIVSTADDIARFMLAHLGSGPPLLRPETLTLMHARHFSQHPSLPGVTYGFWESDYFGHHALYHAGGVRGFGSLLYLMPDERTGIFVVNNGNDQSLGYAVVDAIAGELFPHDTPPASTGPDAVAQRLGRYRFLRHARTTIERLGLLRAPEGEAFLDVSHRLHLGEYTFVPDDRGAWRASGSYERAALLEGGKYAAIDTDVLERVPWWDQLATQELAFVALCIVFITTLVPKRGAPLTLASVPPPSTPPARLARLVAAINLTFVVALAIAFVSIGPGDIWFGYPWPLYTILALPLIAAVCTLPLLLLAPLSRVVFAEVGFLALLWHFNLVGWRV